MSKSRSTGAETHRSFTVRIPLSLYLEIGQLAQDEESNINAKVNQLLLLGLDKHISLDAALRRLMVGHMTMTETTPNVG
jgi:hypothetical protein